MPQIKSPDSKKPAPAVAAKQSPGAAASSTNGLQFGDIAQAFTTFNDPQILQRLAGAEGSTLGGGGFLGGLIGAGAQVLTIGQRPSEYLLSNPDKLHQPLAEAITRQLQDQGSLFGMDVLTPEQRARTGTVVADALTKWIKDNQVLLKLNSTPEQARQISLQAADAVRQALRKADDIGVANGYGLPASIPVNIPEIIAGGEHQMFGMNIFAITNAMITSARGSDDAKRDFLRQAQTAVANAPKPQSREEMIAQVISTQLMAKAEILGGPTAYTRQQADKAGRIVAATLRSVMDRHKADLNQPMDRARALSLSTEIGAEVRIALEKSPDIGAISGQGLMAGMPDIPGLLSGVGKDGKPLAPYAATNAVGFIQPLFVALRGNEATQASFATDAANYKPEPAVDPQQAIAQTISARIMERSTIQGIHAVSQAEADTAGNVAAATLADWMKSHKAQFAGPLSADRMDALSADAARSVRQALAARNDIGLLNGSGPLGGLVSATMGDPLTMLSGIGPNGEMAPGQNIRTVAASLIGMTSSPDTKAAFERLEKEREKKEAKENEEGLWGRITSMFSSMMSGISALLLLIVAAVLVLVQTVDQSWIHSNGKGFGENLSANWERQRQQQNAPEQGAPPASPVAPKSKPDNREFNNVQNNGTALQQASLAATDARKAGVAQLSTDGGSIFFPPNLAVVARGETPAPAGSVRH